MAIDYDALDSEYNDEREITTPKQEREVAVNRLKKTVYKNRVNWPRRRNRGS